MILLKEYIKLIVEELINEDIDVKKLSPSMIGIYSLAQAMNKLIYLGAALPGALQIDIIDAGKGIKSAPMTTSKERKSGLSFQSDRSGFKLYLNPSFKSPRMIGDSETHDLIHAFTGHLAKKFGKRKQSIEQNNQYTATPSEFNRTRLDKDAMRLYNDAFRKAFNFAPPDEVFTNPFKMSEDNYTDWFMNLFVKEFTDKEEKKNFTLYDIRLLSRDTYNAVLGDKFSPGRLSKRYYVRYEKFKKPFDFTNYSQRDFPFRAPLPDIKYNESLEDEEELGNNMLFKIKQYVTQGKKIPDPEDIAKKIRESYKKSLGLTKISPDEFWHRYDTDEVENSMKTLFELYNEFLDRYKKAQAKKAEGTS